MSEISDLQARLNEEKSRNHELRGYLMELQRGVASAGREMSEYVSGVQNSLDESRNKINSSHEYIIQAHELQIEIDKLYVRFKNMELANKRIRECNEKKYYDFANYTNVRKIVQGMLDNLDLHLISDSIIYQSVEKEHLKTPDYWLTAVLLSVMAWKNDDKSMAERAIEIAVKLDKKKSSIFYMLFNIRMGRNNAALKWFMVYQECELRGEDQNTFLMLFSMLSKTINDTIEEKMRYEIIDYINRIINLNLHSASGDEQNFLNTIEQHLSLMKDDDKLETTMLKRCLLDYTDMADIIVSAENNLNIIQFIMDILNVTEQSKNTFVEQYIREEIAKPNEAELSVYREIEYNELVIFFNGDIQKARQIYEERQKKRMNRLNLVSEIIEWIYKQKDDETVNNQVRRNMFYLTEGLQRKAVEQYVENYRKRVRDIHPATLGDYSTDIDFNNLQGEREKIIAFCEGVRNTQLSQLKNVIAIVGIIIAACGLGLTIYMRNPSYLILLATGVVLIAYNNISNKAQKSHIQENCSLSIKNKCAIMDELFAEYAIYKQVFAEYDAYYDKVNEVLDQF